MILLIGGEKGGSGKSTIATNLAVAFMQHGKDVMLLDADSQMTAARWSDRRNQAGLPAIHSAQKTGDIAHTVIDLATRYDIVIIDAGGHDSKELRTGMIVCDFMMIPVRASQADLETMPHVDELIAMARTINNKILASAILSMAPTNPQIKEAAEAREFFAEFENFGVAETIIRDRKIFRDALLAGKGVVEMHGVKARNEIDSLCSEITEATRNV